MAKKEKKEVPGNAQYAFRPGRDLTISEITLMLQKIVGNWRMTQEQYDALPEDLKDVFAPVEEGDE